MRFNLHDMKLEILYEYISQHKRIIPQVIILFPNLWLPNPDKSWTGNKDYPDYQSFPNWQFITSSCSEQNLSPIEMLTFSASLKSSAIVCVNRLFNQPLFLKIYREVINDQDAKYNLWCQSKPIFTVSSIFIIRPHWTQIMMVRQSLLSHGTHYILYLKMEFCYGFGFPSHEIIILLFYIFSQLLKNFKHFFSK